RGGLPAPPPEPEVEAERKSERDAAIEVDAMAFMHAGFFAWVKDNVWTRDSHRWVRSFKRAEAALVQAGHKAKKSAAALQGEVLASRLAQRDAIHAQFAAPAYRELLVSRWLLLAQNYVAYREFVAEHPLPKAPGIP